GREMRWESGPRSGSHAGPGPRPGARPDRRRDAGGRGSAGALTAPVADAAPWIAGASRYPGGRRRSAGAAADPGAGAGPRLASDAPGDALPDGVVAGRAVLQPRLHVRHLVEQRIAELRFVPGKKQVRVEGELDDDAGAIRTAVPSDVAETARHPPAQSDREVGREPAAEELVVEAQVLGSQEATLLRRTAARAGARLGEHGRVGPGREHEPAPPPDRGHGTGMGRAPAPRGEEDGDGVEHLLRRMPERDVRVEGRAVS